MGRTGGNGHRVIKRVLIGLAIVLVVAFVGISGFAGNYLVDYALTVNDDGTLGSMNGEPYTGVQDTEAQRTYDAWVQGRELDAWTIENEDGLELWAQLYPADEPTHRYVLAVHGYTVDHRDIAPAIVPFVEAGYNVLTPDERGRGNSEGDFLSMGYLEKRDVVAWANEICARDPEAEIVLYGESMGAATVLMASGEDDLPRNVVAVVEDCGYTSAYAMFTDQLQERFGLPEFPFLPAANLVCAARYGFFFSDADAEAVLATCELPILFIHGGADDYVPTYMGEELYDAYDGEKELLIVDGAGHGASSDVDPELYYQTIFAFLDEYVS
ncbi:alpha/beta hydrolase [[Collinsella] massiliensis]|uniref:Alpha/beta hydrolase n=1 Tax=[Collinsella] massiliensis TaxID=1232426 RepID=A0A1Y3XU63_9ACTN|nr:alpha/beta hydrolase [[Collinsella] massiliensis]OUN88651.1 alpha/beta hydrolase [[Collinsella] massiliensis]